MKMLRLAAILLIIGVQAQPVRSDFVGRLGPSPVMSASGHLIARCKSINDPQTRQSVTEVSFHEFDHSKDTYVRKTSFSTPHYPDLLFLSDAGDVMMVSLQEKEAMAMFSKDGKLIKSWSLREFLTGLEIRGCAKTGSTLQWFSDGGFTDTEFQFTGPAHSIKAVASPYTIMRGVDPNIKFAATIDVKTGSLTRVKLR